MSAARYRALMLQAYEQEVEAFTSTVVERAPLPISWWEERLSDDHGTSAVFGGFMDGTLVGAAGIKFANRHKTQHKAKLFGLYVAQHSRGQGLGKELVLAVLDYAKSRDGTKVVQLTFTEGNNQAQTLYESCGFKRFGTEPLALLMNGEYRSKVHMWTHLTEA